MVLLIFVLIGSVHGLRIFGAQLEHLSHLYAARVPDRRAAGRARVAFSEHFNVGDNIALVVASIVDVFDMDDNILIKHSISEIVKAVEILSLKSIGALIVIERDTKISEVLKESIALKAKISSELIQNIFMPRTPLHDGAIVISGTEIVAAKCILPLASEVTVPKALGTRHRAAVGITEISDALVIVVSEETGIISVAENGTLTRNLTGDTLKDLLLKKTDRTKLGKNNV